MEDSLKKRVLNSLISIDRELRYLPIREAYRSTSDDFTSVMVTHGEHINSGAIDVSANRAQLALLKAAVDWLTLTDNVKEILYEEDKADQEAEDGAYEESDGDEASPGEEAGTVVPETETGGHGSEGSG